MLGFCFDQWQTQQAILIRHFQEKFAPPSDISLAIGWLIMGNDHWSINVMVSELTAPRERQNWGGRWEKEGQSTPSRWRSCRSNAGASEAWARWVGMQTFRWPVPSARPYNMLGINGGLWATGHEVGHRGSRSCGSGAEDRGCGVVLPGHQPPENTQWPQVPPLMTFWHFTGNGLIDCGTWSLAAAICPHALHRILRICDVICCLCRLTGVSAPGNVMEMLNMKKIPPPPGPTLCDYRCEPVKTLLISYL